MAHEKTSATRWFTQENCFECLLCVLLHDYTPLLDGVVIVQVTTGVLSCVFDEGGRLSTFTSKQQALIITGNLLMQVYYHEYSKMWEKHFIQFVHYLDGQCPLPQMRLCVLCEKQCCSFSVKHFPLLLCPLSHTCLDVLVWFILNTCLKHVCLLTLNSAGSISPLAHHYDSSAADV